MFKIAQTEDRGQVALATTKIEPGPMGLKVFKEKALLTMPTRGSDMDNSGSVPEILAPGPQMWTDWWVYQQQSDDIKQRVLNMYNEMDCPHATSLRDYLLKKKESREDEKIDNDNFDGSILDHIEEFVHFTMVIRFNSVELCPPRADGSGPGKDFGHGLFEKACKMSHSCKPNCVWISNQEGTCKEIRAVSIINEGEELTVDYVGDLLEPIPKRRKQLMMSKGFLCECCRCAGELGDDTRRFPCSTKSETDCKGVHFLNQPLQESIPTLNDCSICGAKASESYVALMLGAETKLVNEIAEIDKKADDFGVVALSDRIENLRPPHDLHSLAERCYSLQAELYCAIGDHRAAAEAYAKQISCRVAILGTEYCSQATAFCCEKLGDALSHVNIEEAEGAYKKSFRFLQKIRGGSDDPYTRCSLNKLMHVQNRRVHARWDALPHQTGLEGIGECPDGPPKAEYPCALCGNPSSLLCHESGNYCSEEHKLIHTSKVYKPTEALRTILLAGN